jgi:hypothetical protein
MPLAGEGDGRGKAGGAGSDDADAVVRLHVCSIAVRVETV